MRREQIFKICLNFVLSNEVEFKRKDDHSWTFAAVDFSEGEFEPTSFALRLKNKEVAEDFKKAIDDALVGGGVNGGEKQESEMDEKAELVKRLQLPEHFFDYLNAPDCLGCIGCKSDDFIYTVKKLSNPSESNIQLDQPNMKSRPKPRRQSVDKHVSFNVANDKENSENEKVKQLFGTGNVQEKATVFGGGIRKSEGTSNIFAAYNSENPPKPLFGTQSENVFGASTPEGIFGSGNKAFGTPGNSIFSSSLNTTPAKTPAEVTFGSQPAEPFSGGLFGSKTNFSVAGSGDNIFSGVKENGDTANKPFGAFSTTPAFGSNVFGGGAIAKTDSAAPASTNIFGSTFKSTFSFADAAKDLDKNNEGPVVPDFLQKESESGGFAALVGDKSWAGASSSTAEAPTGGFFGLTVKEDFFSKNLNKLNNPDGDTGHEENAVNDENYDPHYDPIISLPDEIKVSTGEEEEEKMFGERAKLFRYDAKTKEWKERGK